MHVHVCVCMPCMCMHACVCMGVSFRCFLSAPSALANLPARLKLSSPSSASSASASVSVSRMTDASVAAVIAVWEESSANAFRIAASSLRIEMSQ